MAVKVLLNNVLQDPANYDGAAGAQLSIRNGEGQRPNFSFSSELTLRGAAKDLIFSQIINSPNPRAQFVGLRILDDCCQDGQGNDLLLFEGRIGYEGLRWCEEECTVVVSASDASVEADAITCLRNTLIYDRVNAQGTITSQGEDEGRQAAYLRYCTEARPRSSQDVLMYLGALFLNPAFIIILTGIGVIIGRNIVQDFTNSLTGCGKIHKAPFFYSYLKNVCKLCGLNLRSTLFDIGRPMHDFVRLDAAFEEGGGRVQDADVIFQALNVPNIGIFELLDTLKEVGISYAVSGNTLIVERKNDLNQGVLIDLTLPQNADLVQSSCYEYTDEAPPAGLLPEFQEDLSDRVGNEARRLFSGLAWNFNTPPNPAFRGIKRVQLPYGASRTIDDNFPESVLRFWRIFLPYAAYIDTESLIFERGTFSAPKLLEAAPTNAGGLSVYVKKVPAPNGRNFVSPAVWLNQNTPAPNLSTLLDQFDPRTSQNFVLDFEVVITATCDVLRNLGNAKQIVLSVGGQGRTGNIEEIDFNLATRELTIKGKV